MNDHEYRTSLEERLSHITKMIEDNPQIPIEDWLAAFGVVEIKWAIDNRFPLNIFKNLLEEKRNAFINSYEEIKDEETNSDL